MTLKIKYLNSKIGSSNNKALILSKDTKISDFKGIFDNKINIKIANLIKNNKKIEDNKISSLNLDFDKNLIIILIAKNNDFFQSETLGAKFYEYIKRNNINDVLIIGSNFKSVVNKIKFESFLHGAELKSYEFNIYKSKKKNKIISFNILNNKNLNNQREKKKLNALLRGVNFTKDLVSEPGNILHPDEYAKRLVKLKKFGLKVTVYDKKKLKKLGCNALLGVGQGSIRGSYLVTMEWKGSNSKSKPLAFVGKGVCFDTGGISLKPARFMEDMTYDMAGSAVVVGLMKNLALRKAKINAVGVVGLVENMPGGNAQRPGDIVKSYSGKTIEILNTDAEGRLVLCDALTYSKKFNPKYVLDMATLTGACLVGLGKYPSGLFSNSNELADLIKKSADKTGDRVWQLPLYDDYFKELKTNFADIQNIGGRYGGAITAAAFLAKFTDDVKWAHLDIAGTAWEVGENKGSTGRPVSLLINFVLSN